MIKAIIASLALAFSVNAVAAPTIVDAIVAQTQLSIYSEANTLGLDWKVGDSATYSVDMGFIKGSMVMSVRSNDAEGIWMVQDVDLGFAGKQKVEILIDGNTGEIKKMIVNGKDQEIPKQDIEIISASEDKITVAAGTFECIHIVMKDNTSGDELNVWINPQVIPMSGMIKQVQPSQLGKVTIALKSFVKK